MELMGFCVFLLDESLVTLKKGVYYSVREFSEFFLHPKSSLLFWQPFFLRQKTSNGQEITAVFLGGLRSPTDGLGRWWQPKCFFNICIPIFGE